MQDVGGGHLVDDLGPPLAAGVGGEQRARDGDGGQPLVPESHGHVHAGLEVARELAHRPAARPLAAVHVEGQAEHHAADSLAVDDPAQRLGVPGELPPPQRPQGRGDGEGDVGQRQAQGLRPHVDAEPALAFVERFREFSRVAGDHGGCYVPPRANGRLSRRLEIHR